MMLSIIVPVYNEIDQLPELLGHLRVWRQKGHEILLVDGGSSDQTAEVAEAIGFRVIRADKGRATQMNAGASNTSGKVFLFLHADTRLPENADHAIKSAVGDVEFAWGRFNVSITGNAWMLKIIACFINQRSRFTGIATGDQAIFVTRKLFYQIGGFPVQPLMEDVEISKRLRRVQAPICLKNRVKTSGRRWLEYGIWRTIFLMWRLRWAYWRGVPAYILAKEYQ